MGYLNIRNNKDIDKMARALVVNLNYSCHWYCHRVAVGHILYQGQVKTD